MVLYRKEIILTESEIIIRSTHFLFADKIIQTITLNEIRKCEVDRQRPGLGLKLLSHWYQNETFLQIELNDDSDIEIHLVGSVKEAEGFVAALNKQLS